MASAILEKLQCRYATKKFDTTKSLSEEKLEILKSAFNLTATSYGLQPLKLVLIGDSELKKNLVSISMDQEQVAQASHVLVFCIEKEMPSNYIVNHFNRIEATRNTPREILDPFQDFLVENFKQKDPEAVRLWMIKQAYLAMGNLLTVCAMEGIDACPMEGFDPAKYDQLLNLAQLGLESVLVMPVGYRANDDFMADLKKVRRGVDEVVIEM